MAGKEPAASHEGMPTISIFLIHAQWLIRWQYERIDPDELQALKSENERLKTVEATLKERPPVTHNTEVVDQLKRQVGVATPDLAKRSQNCSLRVRIIDTGN